MPTHPNEYGEKAIARENLSPEAPFLVEVFNRLNESKVRYSVLRNYRNLPYDLDGSDIDMLVAEEQFDEACELLYSVAVQFGGRCISTLTVFRTRASGFCGKYQGKWWGVRFDTFPFVGTNDCDILSADLVLQRSFSHNGVRVANPNDTAVLAFVKDVLGAGRDRKGYAKDASRAYAEERHLYSSEFKRFFANRTFKRHLNPLLEGKRKNLSHEKKVLRRNWRWLFFKQHPLESFARYLSRWLNHLHMIWRPLGVSVAVLGTDGSGKSTIIEGIRSPLEHALHTRMVYEHLRPNLLPSLARLLGRPELEGPVTDPHSSNPSGLASSLLRITYYSLDYIFGHWLKVFPVLVKRPTIWVFDRYFYDYLIDPRRSRLSLPRWVVRVFSMLIPRPDIILCLGAEPGIMHGRKPEISIEEVRRQVGQLREFCAKEPRAVWVDTGCKIEESIDQALEAITSRMAARYRAI